MWRGQRWLCLWEARRLAFRRARSTTSARLGSQPTKISRSQTSCPTRSSQPIAGSHAQTPKSVSSAPRLAQAGAGFLVALSVLTTAGCSWGSLSRPTTPEQTPAVVPCPVVKCLDRAMTLAGSVEIEDTPRTCKDVFVAAVDALTGLRQSREAHAELIKCVEDFNAEASKER